MTTFKMVRALLVEEVKLASFEIIGWKTRKIVIEKSASICIRDHSKCADNLD
jgi:hypothetical protein